MKTYILIIATILFSEIILAQQVNPGLFLKNNSEQEIDKKLFKKLLSFPSTLLTFSCGQY